MNEAETRAHLIDPALREAGWQVVPGSRIRMEWPINAGRLIGNGQRAKCLKADYILQYKNRNLAVIEAKKQSEYYTEGVGQAKQYAQLLNIRYAFSTNGEQIYRIDMASGKEGDVPSYPSPDELWALTFSEVNEWRDKILTVPFEDRGGTWQPRYYQDNAITKVLEAIVAGKDRILLTMATGTGKTAVAFQIAWKLFQARWNRNLDGQRIPRILFLADRNILADQAFNAFSAFEEDALIRIRPEDIRKKGKVPTNGSVFFTIFQTFMSGPNGEPYFGEYPEDFFDLIIIDECHRGGAQDESTWRAIMEYFSPAVQIGLTATPKRDKNVDTYKYFGEPVYVYSLKEGINDGFLTPFRVKQIDTTIDKYTYTDDDIILDGEIEYGREYTERDFNTIIEIKEREAYRVRLLLDMINQDQKTLVFCATQLHALAVRDLINQEKRNSNPNYCHRVTADDGKLGEQYLREFQDNEKTIPTVLTTSQKLSTGVDAPQVRNIVLLRPVNSMIEFKQIVGRGTRLSDRKDYFTIYDFVEAHEHFKDPSWDGEPLEPDPPGAPRPPKTCAICGKSPCTCEKPPPEPCPECGNDPCVCEHAQRQTIKVKLSDGKVRELQHMTQTTFWSTEGKPISAEQFLKSLFGDLPGLFKDEETLRQIWSNPGTRRKLLEELGEKGYAKPQLQDLQRLIEAEDSDLYDVLAYVAFSSSPVQRTVRANKAKIHLASYDPKQQAFLNFVLDQYVASGVDQLDDSNLPDLLELKYKALADAKRELGEPGMIREVFVGFQRWLYEGVG